MKRKGRQINESSPFSSHRDSQQPRVYVSRKNDCAYHQMWLGSVAHGFQCL
jgi:hypothetical protein